MGHPAGISTTKDSEARFTTGHRRLLCLLWLAAILPLGLVWRLAPLHLPQFAFKYGGSALWAIAVYWIVAFFNPRRSRAVLAWVTAGIAAAVEFFKLVRNPILDSFRQTLPGKLLLGRYFTFGAILAYWIAIAAVAAMDARRSRDRAIGPA